MKLENNPIIKLDPDGSIAEQSMFITRSRSSFLTKKQFIEMIENMNFDTIKNARISFNTSYEYVKETKDSNPYVKTYGFEIEIS